MSQPTCISRQHVLCVSECMSMKFRRRWRQWLRQTAVPSHSPLSQQFMEKPSTTIITATLSKKVTCCWLTQRRDSGRICRRHVFHNLRRTQIHGTPETYLRHPVASHLAAVADLRPGKPFVEIYEHAAEVICDGLRGLGIMKGDPHEAVKRERTPCSSLADSVT